jgi:hypothetical protein
MSEFYHSDDEETIYRGSSMYRGIYVDSSILSAPLPPIELDGYRKIYVNV